jgi:hypothetical protein
MPDYTIATGDCLSSIARRHGFADYRTIYDHPRNAALRAARPNPNVLFPGDVLFIPEKEPRIETRPTEQRHVFRTRVTSTRLRIRLTDRLDRPREGVEYTLSVDRLVIKKKTGADGLIDEAIPADASTARLTFDATGATRVFALGGLDPLDSLTGVQQRLRNLGYDCGPVDGEYGPGTRSAVRAFQRDNPPLAADGVLGEATRSAILEKHGC